MLNTAFRSNFSARLIYSQDRHRAGSMTTLELNQCFDPMTNPVPGIPIVVRACTILRAEREREESLLIPQSLLLLLPFFLSLLSMF